MEQYVNEDLFGFRLKILTREAIISLRMIMERGLDKNQNTIVAFIDLENGKPVVAVILHKKKFGIDWKDKTLI